MRLREYGVMGTAMETERDRSVWEPAVSDRRLPVSADLPASLRDWFSDATLISWVGEEIQKLHWDHPEVCRYLQQHPEDDPASLLAVLAFALAGQVSGTEAISVACRVDPALHRLCRGRPPFAHELATCRRQHRPVLERILTRLFARAIAKKFGISPEVLPAELEEDLRSHAADRLDLARHLDR